MEQAKGASGKGASQKPQPWVQHSVKPKEPKVPAWQRQPTPPQAIAARLAAMGKGKGGVVNTNGEDQIEVEPGTTQGSDATMGSTDVPNARPAEVGKIAKLEAMLKEAQEMDDGVMEKCIRDRLEAEKKLEVKMEPIKINPQK
eukprot:2173981-Alexandrium_andersonii.AAC.1